jgi:hypothetical protein
MISSRCLSWTCASTWSTLNQFFFLYNDDVLKKHMRAHSILFFKNGRYRLNSLKTDLPITPWLSLWSSHNLLHYLLTTLNPTYGSSIVYGQVLQTSLNATISPQGLSLITKTTHGAPYVLSKMKKGLTRIPHNFSTRKQTQLYHTCK